MAELRALALQIKAIKDGEAVKLPIAFFQQLSQMRFSDRWDNPTPQPGSVCKNLRSLSQLPHDPALNEIVFHGVLAEVEFINGFDLIGWDGTQAHHPVPLGQGKFIESHFCVAPDLGLIVVESLRGIENKLYHYLMFWLVQHWYPLNSSNPSLKFDSIQISAIPKEENPEGILRNNPSLGSFEAVIEAREFTKQEYGVFSGLFSNLGEDDQRLKVKIEISAHRGKELPSILTTHLADFFTNIEDENLKRANVREVYNGRRSRPTRLLDALLSKSFHLEEDTDLAKKDALYSYLSEVIEDLGDQFEDN